MNRLLTLGRTSLVDADGKDLGLAAQPLAILAYLAVRGAGVGVRRDELMALFWPESDSERARTALRAALYRLRQSVGEELMDPRGPGVVALAPQVISCDAAEFAEACRRDAWEDAMAIYEGPFLPGLHLARARDFDDWHQQEGARLAKLANGACWTLAEGHAGAGSSSSAKSWAARAMSLEPYSEPGLRRQMTLLARLGDRAGLVMAYRDFEGRLLKELEIEPTAETVDAFQALEGEAHRAVVEETFAPYPTQGASVSSGRESAGVVSATESPSDRKPFRPPTLLERLPFPARWVIAAGTVAAIATVVFKSGAALPDTPTIAVLPFEYTGASEHVYLGGGLSDILGRRLETIDGIRVRDVAGLAETASAAQDPAAFRAALIGAGVHYYVTGSVETVGNTLELSAELHPVTRSRALASAKAAGPLESAFSLIDDLVGQLVVDQVAAWGSAPTDIPGGDPGLGALRAYLEGEAHIRAGRHEEALAVFRRAVRQDSTFAWAHYGRSRAAEWAGWYGEAQVAAERAWELRVQLPVRERALLEAWRTSLIPDPVRADTLFALVAGQNPDFGEAWLRLAEHRYHWGPLIGRPVEEGTRAFERATWLMPNNAEALLHLLRLKVRGGAYAKALEIVDLIRNIGPGGVEEAEVDLLEAFLRADSMSAVELLTTDAQYEEVMVLTFAVNAPTPTASLWGFHTIQRRETPVELPTLAARVRRAASMGRLTEVDSVLRIMARSDPVLAFEYGAEIATLPGLPSSAVRTEASQRGIERLQVQDAAEGVEFPERGASAVLPSRRYYLLGLLALQADDGEAALDFATRARVEGINPHDSEHRSRTLEAAVRLSMGEAEEALQALGVVDFGPGNTFPQAWVFESARNRLVRAQALAAVGRYEEALRWFGSFPEPAGSDIAYLPAVRLGQSRVLLSMGRMDEAHVAYAGYLELLSGADADVVRDAARIPELEEAF